MRILNLLFLSLVSICSCSDSKTPIAHNYHEIKNHLISWGDIFAQDSDDYYVYFYSERCGHCKEIKQDVISLYLTYRFDFYFVCTDIKAVFGSPIDLIGIDDIDDFYIFGIPFLIHLVEHQLSEYHQGSKEVKDCISILNKKSPIWTLLIL